MVPDLRQHLCPAKILLTRISQCRLKVPSLSDILIKVMVGGFTSHSTARNMLRQVLRIVCCVDTVVMNSYNTYSTFLNPQAMGFVNCFVFMFGFVCFLVLFETCLDETGTTQVVSWHVFCVPGIMVFYTTKLFHSQSWIQSTNSQTVKTF